MHYLRSRGDSIELRGLFKVGRHDASDVRAVRACIRND